MSQFPVAPACMRDSHMKNFQPSKTLCEVLQEIANQRQTANITSFPKGVLVSADPAALSQQCL